MADAKELPQLNEEETPLLNELPLLVIEEETPLPPRPSMTESQNLIKEMKAEIAELDKKNFVLEWKLELMEEDIAGLKADVYYLRDVVFADGGHC